MRRRAKESEVERFANSSEWRVAFGSLGFYQSCQIKALGNPDVLGMNTVIRLSILSKKASSLANDSRILVSVERLTRIVRALFAMGCRTSMP